MWKPNLKFLSVLDADTLALMIKVSKLSLKTTENQVLKALIQKKIVMLQQAHFIRENAETNKTVDPSINFIGLPTYDIRLIPKYKKEFALDEAIQEFDLS